MTFSFVHMHMHSEYSLIDSIIRLDDLVRTAGEMNMPAVAITDHNSMAGALKLYRKAKGAGIKPLIGCEIYVKETDFSHQASIIAKNFNLVLLAMNVEGYRNLLKLFSHARKEKVTLKTYIDNKLLAKHRKGLLALSGDAKGQIPWLLYNNSPDEARDVVVSYQKMFGDRFYLELQQNGISGWENVQDGLLQLGQDLGVKVIASNDCHYLHKEDYFAHQVFLCIQTGRTINDPKRFSFADNEFYFKSPEEMARQFERCPEPLANTLEVAERCNLELSLGGRHSAVFPILPGENLQSMLEQASRKGLEQRLNDRFSLADRVTEREQSGSGYGRYTTIESFSLFF